LLTAVVPSGTFSHLSVAALNILAVVGTVMLPSGPAVSTT